MAAVLVIEDDDRIRLPLLLALEDEGDGACGAASAEEGLVLQRRDRGGRGFGGSDAARH